MKSLGLYFACLFSFPFSCSFLIVFYNRIGLQKIGGKTCSLYTDNMRSCASYTLVVSQHQLPLLFPFLISFYPCCSSDTLGLLLLRSFKLAIIFVCNVFLLGCYIIEFCLFFINSFIFVFILYSLPFPLLTRFPSTIR